MVYTPEQKAEIIQYTIENGPSAAFEKYGVARTTINSWRKSLKIPAIRTKRQVSLDERRAIEEERKKKRKAEREAKKKEKATEIIEVDVVDIIIDDGWRERAERFYEKTWIAREQAMDKILTLIPQSKSIGELS